MYDYLKSLYPTSKYEGGAKMPTSGPKGISTCDAGCGAGGANTACGMATVPATKLIPAYLTLDGATVPQINVQRYIADINHRFTSIACADRFYDPSSATGYLQANSTPQANILNIGSDSGSIREVIGVYLKISTAPQSQQVTGTVNISATGTGWPNPVIQPINAQVVASAGCEREFLFLLGNVTTLGDPHISHGVLMPGSTSDLNITVTVNLPSLSTYYIAPVDRFAQEEFGLLDRFFLRG